MKAMKKVGTLLLAGVLAMGTLAGCANSNSGNSTSGAAANGDTINIGIIQSIEHEALNASYEGFKEALEDNGYVEGKNVNYDYQNAQGDSNNLSTISDRFVGQKKDLVLAISTDAAQAMAGKTASIPILATAVTSYTIAELVDSDEAPGGNVTGTSDMNPVADQIDLITELVPDAKTIGLIYNSSEDNSVLQTDIAKEQIEKLGLKWEEVTVTSVNDVQQTMQSLVGKCDAIYIPTDNTIASAMATVHGVAREAKIPTICGEANMVLEGGLATMGIDYRELGYKTGLMAIKVLEGADPATTPIEFADSSDDIIINAQVAEEIGYTIPDEYKDKVVDPRNS